MTPPVVFKSVPLPVTHWPQKNRHGIAVGSPFYVVAIARRLYCGDTAVMEVLLRFLYGTTAVMSVPRRATAVMAVPRRSHCGLAQPTVACGSFEHVQSFRRAPAKVRRFDSFPRCYDDQWRNHCGITAIMAVPLRFMPYKHRSGTAPPVWRGYYLSTCITQYAPGRSLRSADQGLLTVHQYRLERYGRRCFSVAGAPLWNELTTPVKECKFKDTLNTHLFRQAFRDLL